MKAIGVVLAGGRSRRMGTDKALLPVGAGTLLDHMTARLRALDLAQVVICRDAPGGIPDRIPDLGPLGALHSLCGEFPGHDLLIVPVDMPLVTAATLTALLAGRNARPRHYAGQRLPLLLPLTAAAIDAIAARATDPAADRSLASLLRELNAETLPFAGSDAEFTNVNTPEEWRAIGRALH